MARRKTHEEFVAEVKAIWADEFIILQEYVGAHTEILVKHSICNETSHKSPNSLVRGYGCKKCAEIEKGVMKQLSHSTNFTKRVKELTREEYTFLDEYKGNKTSINCRHNSCDNVFLITPNKFFGGGRCPICAAKTRAYKLSKSPKTFKKEVYELVGHEYVVLSEYVNAHRKVLMRHEKCGLNYRVKPNSFLGGNRCPSCRQSKGEKAVAEFLCKYKIPFTPQKFISYKKSERGLRLDFYVGGIAIEYDGRQHYEPVDIFGGEEGLLDTKRRDRIKDKYCADNGIPLIRIPYWDFDNIDAILTEKLLPLLNAKVTQSKVS